MKVKILGTRGEIEPSAPYHSRKSGILIDNKLLFDLGEQEFIDYKPHCIFITHLHPDHAYFVRSGSSFPSLEIPLYAPEEYKKGALKVLSKKITVGPYTIIPIPTEHSLKVKSQAYLITKGHERILYTGDMFWIKKKYHKLLNNLDMVITDGSFSDEGGMIRRDPTTNKPYGHAGIPNLIRFFKPFTDTILFIHFGSWFYRKGTCNARKFLHQLSDQYAIQIIVGYDGMTIDTKKLKLRA